MKTTSFLCVTALRRSSLCFSNRLLVVLTFLYACSIAFAGSATWKTNTTSGDWNTAANWIPNTVPNGVDDIATFGVSDLTEIMQSKNAVLGAVQFEQGSSSYTIALFPGNNLSLNDAGMINQSSVTQSFNCFSNTVDFYNGSTAGENVIYTSTTTGSSLEIITFHDNATAGSATFSNTYNTTSLQNSIVQFVDNASAGTSSITNDGNCCTGVASTAETNFFGDSTAAESTIIYDNGASGVFASQATAASSTITCSAFTSLYFFDNSTAGAAAITCSSDSTTLYFQDFATAGAATINCAGSTVFFDDHSSAGAATFTADRATLHFLAQSDGGTARIVLSNAGSVIVGNKPLAFHLGSLEGDGTATVNRVVLVGGNNLDATFSGNLASTVAGDWLTKVGTGTWTLAGTGSYSGSTTVTDGALVVTSASTPTGSGPVQVNGGTLGGSGTIAGPVTIGTGTGSGAILAPAHGTKTPVTLTIQSRLTFKSDSIYIYTFRAKRDRSKSDKVVANGLTIENGATLDLSGTVQGTLTPGTVFTVIKNTSSTPISGRFGNLPQGAIVTVKGNNFQANYGGGSGDGNSLTLTVVP
jgi:autotransporter-associated beta strand protein